MDAHEASAIRRQLGRSPDALAAELNIPVSSVNAWENGSIKVPNHIAQELRWRGAVAERNAALAASGLPECEWVRSWTAEPQPAKLKDRTAYLTRLVEHEKACPVCQARSTFIRERFGPMPPAPTAAWMRGLAWFGERVDKWPEWVRPAAWVSLVFGLYTLLRILFMLPRLIRRPQEWVTAFEGLALSVSIGAALGLVYGVFRMLRKRAARRPAA